jgi:hypothetical protein
LRFGLPRRRAGRPQFPRTSECRERRLLRDTTAPPRCMGNSRTEAVHEWSPPAVADILMAPGGRQ